MKQAMNFIVIVQWYNSFFLLFLFPFFILFFLRLFASVTTLTLFTVIFHSCPTKRFSSDSISLVRA